MKKSLTILFSLMTAGLLLAGCGSHQAHHHSHPAKTSKIEKSHNHKTAKTTDKKPKKSHKKLPKVNKKDMNKSGLSNSDIKRDSRAINKQKAKENQPVD